MILSRKELEDEILYDAADYKETARFLFPYARRVTYAACDSCGYYAEMMDAAKRGKPCPNKRCDVPAFRDWLEGGKDE